jgi:hypothetical protein
MDEIAQRMLEISEEIARLRADLPAASGEASRDRIYRRLTLCVTEATHLLNQRLHMCQVEPLDASLRERSVGEPPSRQRHQGVG